MRRAGHTTPSVREYGTRDVLMSGGSFQFRLRGMGVSRSETLGSITFWSPFGEFRSLKKNAEQLLPVTISCGESGLLNTS